MESFDELLRAGRNRARPSLRRPDPRRAHGHARLPAVSASTSRRGDSDRKRLVTFVEIDRCATDAIGVVTGCRLGKRALKFRDWGKMAATFIDLDERAAPIRIAAPRISKQRARELLPRNRNKNQQQMRAYRELPDDELFSEEWVRVPLPPSEFPGYKGERLACAHCGEGINFDRFVERDGERLCLACANPDERYYQPL